jgi:serine/threonine-protein kinase HipA
MLILGKNNASQIALCLKVAHQFLVNDADAAAIVRHQIEVIKGRWSAICDEAGLAEVDRNFLWGGSF